MNDTSRVLITGANGHLGRRLIGRFAPDTPVTAVVRSSAARETLQSTADHAHLRVVELDYRNADALGDAARGCTAAVHLVGILKESSTNRYVDAHERATAALLVAARAQHVRRIVYVSILGSDPASSNAALASKGRAERMLLDGGIPTVILRVPMVLGEDDYAARSLRRRARGRFAILLRSASLEQPIYAGDVVDAIVAGINYPEEGHLTLDLAGPESLPRAELVRRAGSLIGKQPRCVSLPLAPMLAVAWLAQRLLANPPVTPAMLQVLDHDDDIDPTSAAAKLGIRLTGLDAMLRRCVASDAASSERS